MILTDPKIYMDSCCFIDMAKSHITSIEANPNSDVWHCKKLLEASRNGDIQVFTSLMTITECLFIKSDNNNIILNPEIKRLFTGLLTSGKGGVISIQPTMYVIERARDLRWVYDIPLKPMDSIHIASALELKCSEFITDDEGIHSQAAKLNDHGLKIINAKNTQLLPSQYRQLNF